MVSKPRDGFARPIWRIEMAADNAGLTLHRLVYVAGMLVTHEHWFVQVLEGPKDVIASLYD